MGSPENEGKRSREPHEGVTGMELEEPEQEPLLVAPAGPAASSARSLTESRRRRRRGVTRENIRRLGPQRTPRTAELLASLWDRGAEESRCDAVRSLAGIFRRSMAAPSLWLRSDDCGTASRKTIANT